jgi:transmembrane sensor
VSPAVSTKMPVKGPNTAYRSKSVFDVRSSNTRPSRLGLRPIVYGFGALFAAAIAIVGIRQWSANGSVSGPVVARDYATQRGQRATVQLPDGSQATLAPATRLRYEANRDGARVVHLQGQAQFTVTHDPARAFTVRAGAGHVRVLGTSFDVRRYDTDRDVEIIVLDGRVSAERTSRSAVRAVVLSAGMVGLITDSTVTSAVIRDSRTVADWTNGRLVFKNTPVPAMLETLSRWYGYEFRVADPAIAVQRVSTVLASDRPDDGLRALEDLLEVKLTRDGNVVTLHPRVPQRPAGPSTRAAHRLPATPSEAGK